MIAIELLDGLHDAAIRTQQRDDLPDFLAERIYTVDCRLQGERQCVLKLKH